MTILNLLINSNLHVISGLPPVIKFISFSYIFVIEQRMSKSPIMSESLPKMPLFSFLLSYTMNFGAFIKSAHCWVLPYLANYKEIIGSSVVNK